MMDPFPMTILLATDGSEEAELAARMAVGIAKGTDSSLHVVNVVDLKAAADPRLRQPLRERARELLDAQETRMREAGGVIATRHLIEGQPDREIVRLAEKIGAGLIVTGSRGLGGVRRALMGSVSDTVVRHAHCPVMVVRPEK
ncbi:MAG TPA: universal stress protein [Rubrobacter sp.]|nr:universal stress protein [Rubrobacter sp.]